MDQEGSRGHSEGLGGVKGHVGTEEGQEVVLDFSGVKEVMLT